MFLARSESRVSVTRRASDLEDFQGQYDAVWEGAGGARRRSNKLPPSESGMKVENKTSAWGIQRKACLGSEDLVSWVENAIEQIHLGDREASCQQKGGSTRTDPCHM